MPGEPAQPLSGLRPAWVGLAARLAPDPGRAWLRPDDAAHARMLRHLGARALHEPLLAALSSADDELRCEDGTPSLVHGAGRALRALLPGQPKPVAALTRSPEVTGLLLQALAGADRPSPLLQHALAAQVSFSLALTDALHTPLVLTGPLTLTHSATRRGLTLGAGQRLALGASGLVLDDQVLDPWGPELGAALAEQHGFAVSRHAQAALEGLGEALQRIAAQDPHAESVVETLAVLELAPSDSLAALGLPLAIGRARLPASPDAATLAHALLRESALHKLTVLRLVDPLVHDEAALPGLLRAVDAWAARRLGLPAGAVSMEPLEGLTTLGQQVLSEVH